jgi:ABC-type polysaccharide/polyol phosphate export permease
VTSEPPAELLFRRRIRPGRALRDLWAVREVVVSLAQRDFLVRYKQTFLGVLWAVFTWLAFVVALISRRARARMTVTAFAALVIVYVVLRISVAARGAFL